MSEKDRFQTLDVLRGVLALLVVTLHWFLVLHHDWMHTVFPALDFFFLMSGFVMSYAYDAPLASTMSVPRFLLVRWIRLWPMIVLGALFGLLRVVLHGRFLGVLDPPGYLAGVTLDQMLLIPDLHNPGEDQQIFPFNVPLWSVFFEVVANLVFVAFYRMLARPWVLASLVALSALGLVYNAFATPMGLNVGWSGPTFYLGFARVLFPFFAGIGLYRLRKAGRLPRWAAGPIPCSLFLLALFGQPFIAYSPLAQLAVVILVLPVVLILAAGRPLQGAWLHIAKRLGDLSYPVYTLHFPILMLVTGLLKYLQVWNPSSIFVSGFLAMVIVLAVSALALQFYDVPVRRWLTEKLVVGRRRVVA